MGEAILPSLIWKPVASTEKSPEIVFVPECKPDKFVMSTPSVTEAINSSLVLLPGAIYKFCGATVSVPL